jgi:hypothetical protein
MLLTRSHALSQAEGDRNCAFKGGNAVLPKGAHRGTFFSLTTFTDSSKVKPNLSLHVKGTFSLDVDDDGNITRGDGEVEYWLGGASSNGPNFAQGFNAKATAPLKKSGHTLSSFALAGTLTGSANAWAASPAAKGQFGGGGSGAIELWFAIPDADCGELRGTFHANAIDNARSGLAAKGYQVERGSSDWQIQGEKPTPQQQNDFRARVNEAVDYSGPLNQRRICKQRMEKLADEIKKKHGKDKLGQCLHKIWLEGADRMFTRWLNEDLPKLKKYDGDVDGLRDLVHTVLETDSMMVFLGIDTCSRELHRRVWLAVQRAFERVLARAYDTQAIQDVLALVKNAVIIGAVSPDLNADVVDTMKRIAQRHIDDMAKELYRYRKEGFKATECNPRLLASLKKAMFAAKQGALLGADGSRITDEVGALLSQLKMKDISACNQEQRQKDLDKRRQNQPPSGGR